MSAAPLNAWLKSALSVSVRIANFNRPVVVLDLSEGESENGEEGTDSIDDRRPVRRDWRSASNPRLDPSTGFDEFGGGGER
jgi:hypothetical protein